MGKILSVESKYKAFLRQGDAPKNKLSNVRNLFDDVTIKDMYWLKITMQYMERKNMIDASPDSWSNAS